MQKIEKSRIPPWKLIYFYYEQRKNFIRISWQFCYNLLLDTYLRLLNPSQKASIRSKISGETPPPPPGNFFKVFFFFKNLPPSLVQQWVFFYFWCLNIQKFPPGASPPDPHSLALTSWLELAFKILFSTILWYICLWHQLNADTADCMCAVCGSIDPTINKTRARWIFWWVLCICRKQFEFEVSTPLKNYPINCTQCDEMFW